MTNKIKAQVGTWEGKLKTQETEIPLIFTISKENGEYKSTMDSPTQGVVGIPMDKILFENNQLTISFSQAGVKYVGKLEGDKMSGTFSQGGKDLPLELKKIEKKIPGDVTLPSSEEELVKLSNLDIGIYQYSVEDYFAKPKARSFKLSPDGSYLSYIEKDENKKNHVYVKNLKTGKIKRVIEEKEELNRGYSWANDTRLIYVMDKGGNEDYHLFGVDVDGKNLKELTPYNGVKANILAILKEDKDHMIISMNKNNASIFEPYKINVNTGEIKQLYTNDDSQNPITGYEFDKDGNLRGFTKLKDGITNLLFYTAEGKTFNKIKELSWKDTFSILNFNYASKNSNDAYVVSNIDSDKSEIYLYDLKENKIIKKIYSNPDYDVSGISLSRKRGYELDYFFYEGEKFQIIPVSNYYKKLHEKISNKFPKYEYSIADFTDEEDKYLIYITSDKLYGIYYSYDVKKDKFEELFNLMPQLKENDMAKMQPISFTSRDGKLIHGYITLPQKTVGGKKAPVIVNPHGGPQGIRDSWGFNPEAQLFASRGYATLQVNFRISGGYGKEFLQSGFKQIGRNCMDDVEDGLQYVIGKDWVDNKKVAIYGGSHGGYAVLRGLTKTPDLYTCGVDYVGVSNIFTFMKSMPAYWKPYLKIIKEIWYDEAVPEEKLIMEEVSPVFQIDKIIKPLFVVQGANDPRVNINESDQIVKALRNKGINVPYMVKYDEGHGFGKEDNRIELYRAMMGFFTQNLK